MNNATNPVNAVGVALATLAASAPAVVVYALSTAHVEAVKAQALTLVGADKDFADAFAEVATGVAHVMGTAPTYDHWMAVQAAFIADYVAAKGCKEETARQRWVRVCAAMNEGIEGTPFTGFALEKPAKPSKAAEVKAEQRKGAAETAAALIAAAGATTPQAILALSANADAPVAAPVVAALAKAAGSAASDAAKAANEAAREEMKTLRESIRKGAQNLTLAQLREVAALIANLTPKAPSVGTISAPVEEAPV